MDVCTIPFKRTPLTEATNPVKLYEYLAAGKAIVARRLPETEPFSNLIDLYDGASDFSACIEHMLTQNDPALVEKRQEIARQNTWNARYQMLNDALSSLYGRVSIIMVTFKNPMYVRLALDSIFEKTIYPNYEIIVIDNSTEPEMTYLLQTMRRAHPQLKVVFNDHNLGFAAANNVGLRLAAQSDYVVLLNDDVIVTRGWLDVFVRHLRDPQIGLIGPVTNYIGNEACIKVSYADPTGIDAFAYQYTRTHQGMLFDIPVLAMYCLALRRDILEQVGLLDEIYAIGMFEDDDYAMRVRKKGYRVICAEDVFIHHFGSVSFKRLADDEYQRLFNTNRERFERKWGVIWSPHASRSRKPPRQDSVKGAGEDKSPAIIVDWALDQKDSMRNSDEGKRVARLLAPLVSVSAHLQYFDLWQEQGFHVTPVHFYSPIPDTRDLDDSVWSTPSALTGVDLNTETQLSLVDEVFPRYFSEYSQFPHAPTEDPRQFYFDNQMFSGTDALVYYCMLRYAQPKRVIEVGSGYSTLVASQAAVQNGNTEITVIEPYPPDFLKRNLPHVQEIIEAKVQLVDPALFSQLQSGDVLFLDSSHVVRVGGDVNYLILEVLPKLNRGVYVHFHDIFLPYDYPKTWVMGQHRYFWNEQYLVHAFLLFNHAFKVQFANTFMGAQYPEKMRATFPNSTWWGGGSFWIRRVE